MVIMQSFMLSQGMKKGLSYWEAFEREYKIANCKIRDILIQNIENNSKLKVIKILKKIRYNYNNYKIDTNIQNDYKMRNRC